TTGSACPKCRSPRDSAPTGCRRSTSPWWDFPATMRACWRWRTRTSGSRAASWRRRIRPEEAPMSARRLAHATHQSAYRLDHEERDERRAETHGRDGAEEQRQRRRRDESGRVAGDLVAHRVREEPHAEHEAHDPHRGELREHREPYG